MQERSIERGPRVLVVEEDARKRAMIHRVFTRHGYRVEAADGERQAEALAQQTPFDIALLSAHLSQGVGCGVWDRTPVPHHSPHPTADALKTRLQRLRPEMVCLVLNQRSYRRASLSTVEMLSLTERVLRSREEAQRNRRLAHCFRETLLPQPSLPLPGYELACVYEPGDREGEGSRGNGQRTRHGGAGFLAAPRPSPLAPPPSEGLGGDFFDVFTVPDGRIGMMIGDVAGRGLEAAASTAMARFYIRAYANQDASPSRVLAEANEALARDLPDERFVTLFYALLDPASRRLEWASAGHDPPLLLLPGEAAPRGLEPTGIALGILPGGTYEAGACDLPVGTLLLLYTDGVTDPWERRRAAAARYCPSDRCPASDDPLIPLLLSARDLPPAEVAALILDAARIEADGSLEDDVSLIVLRGV